jgi:hypothetical protein
MECTGQVEHPLNGACYAGQEQRGRGNQCIAPILESLDKLPDHIPPFPRCSPHRVRQPSTAYAFALAVCFMAEWVGSVGPSTFGMTCCSIQTAA